jgi:hypothetical protein
MTSDSVLAVALMELAGPRHARKDAANLAPKHPGLYALYGDERAWADLALRPTYADQPLYLGKAEKSLNGRDVGTHFATGKTGSSTVRRSLAALLADRLDLTPIPRNLARPDGSANSALDFPSDARLSAWMDSRLRLATWIKPDGVTLDDVETALIVRLRPPLNLDKVGEPRERLRAARRRMADIARAWEPGTTSPS